MLFDKSEDTKLEELELHDVEYRVDILSRFNSKLEPFQDFVLLLNVIYPTSFEITGLFLHIYKRFFILSEVMNATNVSEPASLTAFVRLALPRSCYADSRITPIIEYLGVHCRRFADYRVPCQRGESCRNQVK